ncbi:MAG TPA: hypothetical protein VMU10_00115 [Desulfomonilia bacterium]|nr:hypothetical protein [Desulfomonilia bacterium]
MASIEIMPEYSRAETSELQRVTVRSKTKKTGQDILRVLGTFSVPDFSRNWEEIDVFGVIMNSDSGFFLKLVPIC